MNDSSPILNPTISNSLKQFGGYNHWFKPFWISRRGLTSIIIIWYNHSVVQTILVFPIYKYIYIYIIYIYIYYLSLSLKCFGGDPKPSCEIPWPFLATSCVASQVESFDPWRGSVLDPEHCPERDGAHDQARDCILASISEMWIHNQPNLMWQSAKLEGSLSFHHWGKVYFIGWSLAQCHPIRPWCAWRNTLASRPWLVPSSLLAVVVRATWSWMLRCFYPKTMKSVHRTKCSKLFFMTHHLGNMDLLLRALSTMMIRYSRTCSLGLDLPMVLLAQSACTKLLLASIAVHIHLKAVNRWHEQFNMFHFQVLDCCSSHWNWL